MGANSSTEAALPYPPEWLGGHADQATHELAISAVKAISSVDPERFLSVRAPLPELEDTVWGPSWDADADEISAYKVHAASAVKLDANLNRLVYRCVPKKVNEGEFWRCYFCWAHHAVTALDEEQGGRAGLPPARAVLSRVLLERGDDATSNAIIEAFTGDVAFEAFSKSEMEDIMKRDAEDDEKLSQGIAMAVKKGVLEAKPPVEALRKVDVLGKSADTVSREIIAALGDAPSRGCVLILQGLSGTGKGTTVSKLTQALPRCTAWSNGNVFRSITLLAVTRSEQAGVPFSADDLSSATLAELMQCLSFGKFGANGAFDIKVEGYGLNLLVSEVANTALKDPKVGKNIPSVAKLTQGEVVSFAGMAAEKMRTDGMNVLMEGRAQTLDYVRTPHRFELTLSQPLVIGRRRAAQRMMGSAVEKLKRAGAPSVVSETAVKALLAEALAELSSK